MEHDYKYISENCLEQLYLHDCLCNHLYFQDDRLIFEMDWMEVLASHPLNPYPQAHQSGPGRIELIHPEIIECSLTESRRTFNDDWKYLQLSTVGELDFSDAEFIDYTETKTDEIYQAKMYLLFERNSPHYAIFIHIAYEKSIVMWDALNDVSWFEDEM